MPGTFSPPKRVSDPDMHHGTCKTHVPWCISGSLTSGILWSRWWENAPVIPGPCANHYFAYLVRDPWGCCFQMQWSRKYSIWSIIARTNEMMNNSPKHQDCYKYILVQYDCFVIGYFICSIPCFVCSWFFPQQKNYTDICKCSKIVTAFRTMFRHRKLPSRTMRLWRGCFQILCLALGST